MTDVFTSNYDMILGGNDFGGVRRYRLITLKQEKTIKS